MLQVQLRVEVGWGGAKSTCKATSGTGLKHRAHPSSSDQEP